MKTKIILSLLVLMGIGFSSIAQPGRAALQNRYYMKNGIRSGSITPGEAAHLRKMKRDIRCDVRQARLNDGRIGPMERKYIQKEMRQYKRHRFVATHNRKVRI